MTHISSEPACDIIAAADLHGRLPVIRPCNMLILAGDICPIGASDLERTRRWLDYDFRAWRETIPAAAVLAVAGNHDYLLLHHQRHAPKLNWHLLRDSGTVVNGLPVWGTPWSRSYSTSAEESELATDFVRIPDGLDVLIAHGPPHGVADEVGGKHIGSITLREAVLLRKPRLLICGHAHCAGGTVAMLGSTLVINAAITDGSDRQVREPIMITRCADGSFQVILCERRA